MISFIILFASFLTLQMLQSISMAAENCVVCLIGAMDRLWFRQIILLSEQPLFPSPETPEDSESPTHSPKANSEISLITDQESSATSETMVLQDEPSSPKSVNETKNRGRPTKLFNLTASSTRSHSSLPSVEKHSRNIRWLSSLRLQKTMSCKSLGELELEEVKGFMDLGFVFEKETISKRMMSLIPGLQRLGKYKFEEESVCDDHDHNDENEDKESRGKMRPYLSDAWLIKRPDSPLLNLRIPRVYKADDMKKHLKYWARTVALAIEQES